MHELSHEDGNLITVRVWKKLTGADYDALIPAWENVIEEYGSMRMLLIMDDFQGWEAGAAWDDFQFGVRHAKQVERVAMVGEKKWQRWLAKIGSWFLPGRVRYFKQMALAEAERWVRAN